MSRRGYSVKQAKADVDTAIKQLDQLLQDNSVEKEKDTLLGCLFAPFLFVFRDSETQR